MHIQDLNTNKLEILFTRHLAENKGQAFTRAQLLHEATLATGVKYDGPELEQYRKHLRERARRALNMLVKVLGVKKYQMQHADNKSEIYYRL